MTSTQNKKRNIKPSSPDDTVRGFLAVYSAHILPLSLGESYSNYSENNSYWFITAVKGNIIVTSQEQCSVLKSGQAIVFNQCESIILQSLTDSLCMMIQIQGELLERLLSDKLIDGGLLFPFGGAVVREAIVSISILEEKDKPVNGMNASAYAYTMIMALLNEQTAAPDEDIDSFLSPLVEAAIGIIQEEFAYLEGLDELAERLEVSKSHLIRSFTHEIGMSPGKYLIKKKIDYAKLLLRNEEVSISYVAEVSGFANANYFAKVFRRETGMSPSEYLESAPKKKNNTSNGRDFLPW